MDHFVKQNRNTQGKMWATHYTSFERQVAQIYCDLEAEVEHDKKLGEFQVDVFAIQKTPDGAPVRTAVECKARNRPISINVAAEIRNRFTSLRTDRLIDKGVVVSQVGFTPPGLAELEKHGILCCSLADLQKRVANFEDYVDHLTDHQLFADQSGKDFQNVAEKDAFIELAARSDTGLRIASVVGFIDSWIQGQGRVLTVLGKYGSGKTTTCKYIALRLAKRYRRDPATRIPVFIELRNMPVRGDLTSYVVDQLRYQQHAHIRSLPVFDRMNREGRFVLIFDGFDEIPFRAYKVSPVKVFNDIAMLAQNGAKLIITCRNSFITDKQNLDRLQSGNELHSLLRKHNTRRCIYLQGFTEQQVEDYFERHYGKNAPAILDEIDKKPELKALAFHPILAHMIVSTIHSSKSFTDINVTRLYETYTDIWIRRDDWRCQLSPKQREDISKALAFKLLGERIDGIYYTELLEPLGDYLDGSIDSATCEEEIRTCTFLQTDGDGFYSFVHRSFAEFFVAKYLLEQLTKGDVKLLAQHWSVEVFGFLSGLINNRPDEYLNYVWYVLRNDWETGEELVARRARAVAVSMLARAGVDLSGVNISGASFFRGASLANAILQGADLTGVSGTELCFDGADLSDADLSNSELKKCSFTKSLLLRTRMTSVDLSNADLSSADLRSSHLDSSRLKGIAILPNEVLSRKRKEFCKEIVSQFRAVTRAPAFRELIKTVIAANSRRCVVNLGMDFREVLEPSESKQHHKAREKKKISADELMSKVVPRYSEVNAEQDLHILVGHIENAATKINDLFGTISMCASKFTALYKDELARLKEQAMSYEGTDTGTAKRHAVVREIEDLERRKRNFDKAYRYHLNNRNHVLRRIRAISRAISDQASVSHAAVGPKVSDASFVGSSGLTQEQKRWLESNGALVATKQR